MGLDLGVYMMDDNWGIDFARTFPGISSNSKNNKQACQSADTKLAQLITYVHGITASQRTASCIILYKQIEMAKCFIVTILNLHLT
jgi:hypothetical protein